MQVRWEINRIVNAQKRLTLQTKSTSVQEIQYRVCFEAEKKNGD